MALLDDLFADRGIEWAVHVVQQERARVALAEPADGQLGQPGEDLVADPRSRRADDCDPLGEEAASDEPEDLRRGAVEPLRVVDDARDRLPIGDLREQRQRGEPDQEWIRWRAGLLAEHGCERGGLRFGQAVERSQQWCTQLVEAAVGQLHLRLDADGGRDVPVRGALDDVVEQRALARAGFSAKDDDSAPAGERVGQSTVE